MFPTFPINYNYRKHLLMIHQVKYCLEVRGSQLHYSPIFWSVFLEAIIIYFYSLAIFMFNCILVIHCQFQKQSQSLCLLIKWPLQYYPKFNVSLTTFNWSLVISGKWTETLSNKTYAPSGGNSAMKTEGSNQTCNFQRNRLARTTRFIQHHQHCTLLE